MYDQDFYSSDVKRIVSVFRERGYEVSEEDARKAWEQYSDSITHRMAAGRLYLSEDDSNLFSDVMLYLVPVENQE
jgi:hypothetical protein